MNKSLLLKWLLRLAGVCEMIAFVAVVMPRSWMEVSHTWLGLGEMPSGPILMFMIRQASYTYGVHGLLLWVMSLDVERFRPLVILTGITYLIGAPVFLAIDVTYGMPLWWTVADPGGVAFLGAAILLLAPKPQPTVLAADGRG